MYYRELKAYTAYAEKREKGSGRTTPGIQKVRKNGERNCNKNFINKYPSINHQ